MTLNAIATMMLKNTPHRAYVSNANDQAEEQIFVVVKIWLEIKLSSYLSHASRSGRGK